MSHSIDLEDVAAKLVLLQHYCAGSKEYCRVRKAGSVEDRGYHEYDKYWGWTKAIVSNYLLECSIKLRVLQDTFATEKKEFERMDLMACENLIIGKVEQGGFTLSLRETANKIIHARNVTPTWLKAKDGKVEFQYWDGKYVLTGFKNSHEWRLFLNVNEWAKAFEIFIELFEETDNSLYLGQDFINKKK